MVVRKVQSTARSPARPSARSRAEVLRACILAHLRTLPWITFHQTFSTTCPTLPLPLPPPSIQHVSDFDSFIFENCAYRMWYRGSCKCTRFCYRWSSCCRFRGISCKNLQKRDCVRHGPRCWPLVRCRDGDFILFPIDIPVRPGKGSLQNVAALLNASPRALVVLCFTVTNEFCAKRQRKLADVLNRNHGPLCFHPEFLHAKSAPANALNPWHAVIGTNCVSDFEAYMGFQQCFVGHARI